MVPWRNRIATPQPVPISKSGLWEMEPVQVPEIPCTEILGTSRTDLCRSLRPKSPHRGSVLGTTTQTPQGLNRKKKGQICPTRGQICATGGKSVQHLSRE